MNGASGILVGEIAGRVGLSLTEARLGEAEAGLIRIVEANGLDGMNDLLDRLGGDSVLVEQVVSELTVQETYFFRDPAQFETIRKSAIPALLARRHPDAAIRIWSAGCSTGEEPYSLAIMMEEEGLGDRAQILASDISTSALEKARKAEYGKWSMRGCPPGFERRYFGRYGDRLRLDHRLKRRVFFHWLNLESAHFPSWTTEVDLIFCRNVLMYCDKETVARVARRLFDCLAAGGWLVPGPSDPALWEHAPFDTETTSAGVVYRRRKELPAPPPAPPSDGPNARSYSPPTVPGAPSPSARESSADIASPARADAIRSLIRAGETEKALAAAEKGTKSYPLSAEMHYLHGKASIEAGRMDAAVAALRRAIFLDRDLAAAHFLLGTAVQETDPALAVRAFYNAAEICDRKTPLETVPLCEESNAGRLASVARQRIADLTAATGEAP